MRVYMDIFGGSAPRRGDIVQTNVGDRRERTCLVLWSRRAKREPRGMPRYNLMLARWWELEPEMRMRLYRSAMRRGGQGVLFFHRYPPKRKPTLEQWIARANI